MRGIDGRPRKAPRWEGRALGALMYPANVVVGAIAVLILSVPVVTILPATLALSRAYAAWVHEGDDAVFTNTFREFRATWRRSLPLGLGATVILAVLVVDGVFLIRELTAETPSIGLLFAAATVPLAVAAAVYFFAVAAAGAAAPDGSRRDWLALGGRLMLAMPGRSLAVAAVVVVCVLASTLLPTLAPFVLISVPAVTATGLWLTLDTTDHP
ncbi:YesL family protein [Microbacterium sp. SSW1-59]|uniref:YesL family protein n=1 Tax=Microbacterium xanthum TaxID=3079794 RepID=UPI002AD4D856|nr:YesL family protein [Microbacterium sp. SSW1-59]MDZ8200378.1 YesL family protein [Microbacterium sp. SSW1-59]